MKQFRKRFWTDIALCASFFPLIHSTIAYSVDLPEQFIAEHFAHVNVEKDTYTINFNNVSIMEVIRFASKITHLNFIFNDADLQFTVTMVSEEAVNAKNVMAALTQVLRSHNLHVVEQDGNILITQSMAVNAIPTIISSDLPESVAGNSAIVTRVFRIKNANVTAIANIIRPMTSQAALVEVLVDSKQLIVTDITTNVEQIAQLLVTLDTPHTSLEVESYTVKHIATDELIPLSQKILSPFTEGNPLIFVPQPQTNSIFIVSTPYLIERAMTVLEDLDIPSKSKQISSGREVFLYNPINRPARELIVELKQISEQLKGSGNTQMPLRMAIHSVQEVKDTGALLFIADKDTTTQLKSILTTLDASFQFIAQSAQVFIYKPHYSGPNQIEEALDSLIPSLQKTDTQADKNLVTAIKSLRWNEEMQAFLVTSDPNTLDRLKAILQEIDAPQAQTGPLANGFYLYKLETANCHFVMDQLKTIAQKLPPNNLQNQNLIAAIHKINCIASNNSLLITGNADTIDQVKTLIADFDSPGGVNQNFLIYKAKFLPGDQLQTSLQELGKDLEESGLQDQRLLDTLSTMRFVTWTNSLVFTGDKETLMRVEELINTIDVAGGPGAIPKEENISFYVYKIQHTPADKLISRLKAFGKDLRSTNINDKRLAICIDHVKWMKDTNTLLFTGTPDTLTAAEELVKQFDLNGTETVSTRQAQTFVIYSPKYISGPELLNALQEFERNLQNSGVADKALFDTINHLKWIEATSSLIISGDQQSVDKVQEMIIRHFDIPSKATATPSIESIDNMSFLVYKLQYHPGNDIQVALKQIAANLTKNEKAPTGLSEAISSVQWVQVTNSLLCSGQQDVLVQLKELIQNIDIPLRQVFIEVLLIRTDLTNIQNFGLMWGAQSQYFNKATMAGGNFPLSTTQNANALSPVGIFQPNLHGITATNTPAGGVSGRSVPFVNGFDLGVIGDVIMHKGRSFLSLGALVNALQEDSDSVIVLNPKIITQDNRQSTIFVGSNIPYTGAIVTNQSNSTVTTQNIEYRDVGVSLTITPVLGDGDVVTMDIVHDISEVIGPPPSTSSTQQLTGITTSHTHMETRVQVPDNYFVALSGMINDSKVQFRTAIPCLGGLPVIGALFSENDRTAVKSNVIIFVRPKIVTSYQEYKKITEHQEWLYKDNSRLPVLKEWFDEGIDLVKTPENE